MAIGIYKLTKQNGDPVVIKVPRFSGAERLPDNTNDYTIVSATQDLPEQFDHTATFFVKDDYVAERMNIMGFPDVVKLSDHVGETWRFDNGNYIQFEPTSITLHVGTSTYSLTGTQQDAGAFFSDRANPEWVEGIYSYYGRIKTVNVNSFKFDYDYALPAFDEEGFNALWSGLEPFNPDPLEPGGTSGTGGGDGDFDSDELDLDFPDDPALSAVGTGMVSLFSPTTAQLQALANYLWSTDFDLDLFKKMFAAPLDAILGLSIVPVAVPTSGAVALKFGGWPTTVSMNKTNKQWVTVDCGSVAINKYWGSALDYNPYTKVSIFLPYIGMRELDTDEVMGKSVTVRYKVDILSGACIAMVKCGGAVLYQFAGSCAVQVPVSNRDWSGVIGAAVRFGAGAVAAAATGGASAVGTAAVALNTASAVMSGKVNVSHTGAVGGSAGFMGIQNPFILIKRARQSRPEDYNKIEGYPSNIYETIGNLRGFTQIEKMHLENIPATTSELDELESLMMEGVII